MTFKKEKKLSKLKYRKIGSLETVGAKETKLRKMKYIYICVVVVMSSKCNVWVE